MLKFYSFFLCIVLVTATHAQQRQSPLCNFVRAKKSMIQPTGISALFSRSAAMLPPIATQAVKAGQVLQLNKTTAQKILNEKPGILSLLIPAANNKQYQLELAAQDISSDDLSIFTINETGMPVKKGIVNALHYRGYINGDPLSMAAFSIFENGEVMALFSNEEGNFNVGKLNNNDYVLYNSVDMIAGLGFECGTASLPVIGAEKKETVTPLIPAAAPALLCKKVRFLWEADYKLYSNNFSSNLGNTANYIAGLFNQAAAMYQNEGVLIELNETYIWTVQDPYNTSTSANGLATLKSRYNGLGNNFNADLCMLIDGAPTNNGGLAYILDNDLCNRAYAYGYADVYASYNTLPTYSWDVEVMTHEMGHLLGSYHTQWCGWNTGAGNTCGAIDNCYPVEASPSCSTCNATTNTNPSAPAGFMGTVMSYCYLRSGIGVNLSYGFGPLPQAKIRACINNATCPVLDNQWTGAVSTAWENAGNWSCGSIPDINTDVTIANGAPNYPVVNSAAVCRKIRQKAATTVTVRTGFSLRLAGTGH